MNNIASDSSQLGIFAQKCWPAFEKYFEFVPCLVNSRSVSGGIPAASKVDISGAMSKYLANCATELPVTTLDINNAVPPDMYNEIKNQAGNYKNNALLMGVPLRCWLIMHRLTEPDQDPNSTCGISEDRIKPDQIIMFRI